MLQKIRGGVEVGTFLRGENPLDIGERVAGKLRFKKFNRKGIQGGLSHSPLPAIPRRMEPRQLLIEQSPVMRGKRQRAF